MADLMAGRRTERGQLIVLTGLMLAVTLVALALILNAAIYSGNLATQKANSETTHVLSYRASVEDGVGELLWHANHVNGSDDRSKLSTNVSDGVGEFWKASARQQVRRVGTVNATQTGSTDGSRIVHNDSTVAFENATASGDWNLATGVENTRDFDVTITNSPTDFNVTANESSGSDIWYMVVSESTGTAEIEVYNGTATTYTCTRSVGSEFTINVTAGTFDGSECDALTFAENLDQPYDLNFSNGGTAQGTYSLIVDVPGVADSVSTDSDYNSDGTSPTADEALYSVTVEMVYETPRLHYRADVRVAPGEADD